MRCHYLSDLHLESQDFSGPLPQGEILIIAGDLCHARCLAPEAKDRYNVQQRSRVLRFVDRALANFAHVLLVAGNHEHYDGIFDETQELTKQHLPGVVVLDNTAVAIDGTHFFGTTLWTDFNGRSQACMDAVRRRCGEFFFVKKQRRDREGRVVSTKFQPEDALEAFECSWQALQSHLAATHDQPTIVVSHHAPSRQGLNEVHSGNGLDAAFASDLDRMIAQWSSISAWVHGHTHVRRSYRIGSTMVHSNCRGFEGRDDSAKAFSANAYFEV